MAGAGRDACRAGGRGVPRDEQRVTGEREHPQQQRPVEGDHNAVTL